MAYMQTLEVGAHALCVYLGDPCCALHKQGTFGTMADTQPNGCSQRCNYDYHYHSVFACATIPMMHTWDLDVVPMTCI